MVTINKDWIEGGVISTKLLVRCIEIHNADIERLRTLKRYYDGEHDIINRSMTDGLPNNKLVCNHAQYISDMAVGYVFGVPVQYSNVDTLADRFTVIDEDSHNNELANDISIYGHGLELSYMSNEKDTDIRLATLSPLNNFLVCDDTVEHNPLFAVGYNKILDIDGKDNGWKVTVIDKRYEYVYTGAELTRGALKPTNENKEHFFGDVPVIEYDNNKGRTGDFEGVVSLIDAYNVLQSDRVNDKEQLVDAILAVYGMSFGDSLTEKSSTIKLLKELKILEMPEEGSKAEYLVKNLTESEVEVLKKSLKDDIHEFSMVPCLTDENFVGNASGVAMKYKLLGLEQLGKTKERYFKRGLRKRLELINNIYSKKGRAFSLSEADITMKRSLPVDDELLARIAQETDGFISWETRVQDYNPELDIEEERKRLLEEKKEAAKVQQEAFGTYGFDGSGEKVDEEEE